MSVDLVSITEPHVLTEDGKLLLPEEYIVYIARVSNPDNQLNTATSGRLLQYLIDHKHWSPFEFVDMTVRIVTRRSIAAQILRHRSFSFQEFSQRYSAVADVETIELRRQAEKNRQSSAEVIDDPVLNDMVLMFQNNAIDLYETLLEKGVAREVARDILPLSTQTTLYMKGSVRSWIHYLQLRCAEDTQKEHREIAEAIRDIFAIQFPTIARAL